MRMIMSNIMMEEAIRSIPSPKYSVESFEELKMTFFQPWESSLVKMEMPVVLVNNKGSTC